MTRLRLQHRIARQPGGEIAEGVDIKMWPCCGGTHAANTGIIRLLKERPFKAEDVVSVDIVTTDNPSCMPPNYRWPASGLQGKFSTWFTVASLIVDGGRLDLASFTDEAARRPAVQAMLHRVNIVQDPQTAGRPNHALGGELWWDVSVTLKSGECLKTRVEHFGDQYGWEDREAVFQKFRMLAGAVLKPAQVDSALNAIMELDKARDIRAVMDTVTLAG